MTPDDALRSLCAGDPWSLDRGAEHLVPVLVDAMATAWRPEVAALGPIERARAGYLLTVLRDALPPAQVSPWAAWLASLRGELPRSGGAASENDLAREWGLPRGLEVLRLRRVLRLRTALQPR